MHYLFQKNIKELKTFPYIIINLYFNSLLSLKKEGVT